MYCSKSPKHDRTNVLKLADYPLDSQVILKLSDKRNLANPAEQAALVSTLLLKPAKPDSGTCVGTQGSWYVVLI